MTAAWNWSAAAGSLPAANDALKANLPLPPAPKMTLADVGPALTAMQPEVNDAAAFFSEFPGVVTALDIVLASQGDWTAPMRSFLMALPGLSIAAKEHLPDIVKATEIFQAAPTPPPGMDWKAGDGSDLNAGMPGE